MLDSLFILSFWRGLDTKQQLTLWGGAEAAATTIKWRFIIMAEDMNNNNNNENGAENNQQQENTPKTYTEEEVLTLIQSEADKRVSQALKTQQKRYEKQLSLSKLD